MDITILAEQLTIVQKLSYKRNIALYINKNTFVIGTWWAAKFYVSEKHCNKRASETHEEFKSKYMYYSAHHMEHSHTKWCNENKGTYSTIL